MHVILHLAARPPTPERMLLYTALGTYFGGNGSFRWDPSGRVLTVDRSVDEFEVARRLAPGWGAGLFAYVAEQAAKEDADQLWEVLARMRGIDPSTGETAEALMLRYEVV